MDELYRLIGERGKFSFQCTFPRPPEEENWYEWNLNNWGTKWETEVQKIIEESDNVFDFYCETAWSPPIEWAENTVKRNPNLIITLAYSESGMSFYGKVRITADKTEFIEEGETEFEEIPGSDDIEPVGRYKQFLEETGVEWGG